MGKILDFKDLEKRHRLNELKKQIEAKRDEVLNTLPEKRTLKQKRFISYSYLLIKSLEKGELNRNLLNKVLKLW